MSSNGTGRAVPTIKTEIVRASELREKVVQRIFEIRNPEAMSDYRKELAKYKRRLGNRQEQKFHKERLLGRTKVTGFKVTHLGQEVFVQRPFPPKPPAWGYSGYDRSSGFTDHARQYGLLADALYNREIRKQRVEEYAEEMTAGRWHDLYSDPITITDDGHVLNGQHRIAAAEWVDWNEIENDPAFLVVWGADPSEALHADGSRRTERDETTIATKLLAPLQPRGGRVVRPVTK